MIKSWIRSNAARLFAALGVCGLIVGGVGLAVAANAATVTPVACINGNDPHHHVLVFWTPGGACPAGHYLAPIAGSPGPAGPQGPKGDPGPNSIVFGHAERVMTENFTGDLTIAGQPAYTTLIGKRTLVNDNTGEAPAGVVITVTPVVPVAGATSRTYHVVVTGYTGSTPDFKLEIDTLAVVS